MTGDRVSALLPKLSKLSKNTEVASSFLKRRAAVLTSLKYFDFVKVLQLLNSTS